MAGQHSYTQPTKSKARRLLLERAVHALTAARRDAVVVRLKEFQETLLFAVDRVVRAGLSVDVDEVGNEAERWAELHRSAVGQRRASDLRVLYLCGPEPENDLDVLVGLGVLPENVWAVESHEATYRTARDRLIRGRRFPKVHRGDTASFFQLVNEQFDIVYYDACGPILGGHPNTMRSLLALFEHTRLSPLSALVTNFAEPAQDQRDEYALAMSAYFAMRYDDCPRVLHTDGADPAISMHGLFGDRDHLLPFIRKRFKDSYSDFVTRLVVDVGRQLVPFARAHAISEVAKQYFANETAQRAVVESARTPIPLPTGNDAGWREYFEKVFAVSGAVSLYPSEFPLLHFLTFAPKKIVEPFANYSLGREGLVEAFWRTMLLVEMFNGTDAIASPAMLDAVRARWVDSTIHYFCDLPFPHLMVGCLLGIYGRPYFVNPRLAARYRYTAKVTPMYADCLVLDQCRYLFDYFPTIDLVPARMKSPAFQLVVRSVLDQIQWHDFSSSTRIFNGSALAGAGSIPVSEIHDFTERASVRVGKAGRARRRPGRGV